MANVSEELARLATLRDSGVLTEEEFQAQKAAVLANTSAAPTAKAAPKKGGLGKGATGCLVVIAIVVVLFIIGSLSGGKPTAGSGTAGPPPVAPIAVTAKEVADAYESNEARAQQTYGGKQLLVSATLAGVSLDFANKPFLQLETSGFIPANANLDEASQAKASSLNKGAVVKLLCQDVQEVVSVPQFSDCSIR